MNKNNLKDQIEKYYWEHDQWLTVETMEEMGGDWNNCEFTVYLKDSDIFLFDVTNYIAHKDYESSERQYFSDVKYRNFEKLDLSILGNKPLYMDRVFTLKKTEPITKEDILRCVDYFLREILDEWLIFNIRFDEDNKDSHIYTQEEMQKAHEILKGEENEA